MQELRKVFIIFIKGLVIKDTQIMKEQRYYWFCVE